MYTLLVSHAHGYNLGMYIKQAWKLHLMKTLEVMKVMISTIHKRIVDIHTHYFTNLHAMSRSMNTRMAHLPISMTAETIPSSIFSHSQPFNVGFICLTAEDFTNGKWAFDWLRSKVCHLLLITLDLPNYGPILESGLTLFLN